MNSDIAISVRNLTKKYKLYDKRIDRLKESLSPFRKKYHRDFTALQDISFNIKKGETVGIIGKNGSGKSTLLKLLTGVLTPSSGSVETSGKISALLELGAGFNPNFTGIENIYFNGSIMGFSKAEMDEKIDSILEFADIGEFVKQPVKMYSSGMYVRLAFSLAINVDPDILIVDEALAVGDVAFQMKCIDRINKMIEKGITLFFVSHDAGAVKKLCKRAILLDKGHLLKDSNPDEAFDFYNALLADENTKNIKTQKSENNKIKIISGTGEVNISDVKLFNKSGLEIKTVEVGESVEIRVRIKANKTIHNATLGFQIKDRLGQVIFGTNTFYTGQCIDLKCGEITLYIIKLKMDLGVGNYSVTLAVHSSSNHIDNNYEWIDYALIFEVINTSKAIFSGICKLPYEVVINGR